MLSWTFIQDYRFIDIRRDQDDALHHRRCIFSRICRSLCLTGVADLHIIIGIREISRGQDVRRVLVDVTRYWTRESAGREYCSTAGNEINTVNFDGASRDRCRFSACGRPDHRHGYPRWKNRRTGTIVSFLTPLCARNLPRLSFPILSRFRLESPRK